jgi:quercetin dioxygenase-like cupin family protein
LVNNILKLILIALNENYYYMHLITEQHIYFINEIAIHYHFLFIVCMHAVVMNGFACKDPDDINPEDFLFSGLDKPGYISPDLGSNVTLVNVQKLAGLNTLGISIARLDFAPNGGLVPPHTHPRATEVLTVMQGTLYVGFVTSAPNFKLIAKVLNKGDVFVFPEGLIHFQYNIGRVPAIAYAALSSQNPGVIPVAKAVFGSNQPISDDALAKAFKLDKSTVDRLQSQFWTATN